MKKLILFCFLFTSCCAMQKEEIVIVHEHQHSKLRRQNAFYIPRSHSLPIVNKNEVIIDIPTKKDEDTETITITTTPAKTCCNLAKATVISAFVTCSGVACAGVLTAAIMLVVHFTT